MKVILTPMGSAGDVHPFLALGKRLAERGHEVVGLTNEYFVPLFKAAGIASEVTSPRAAYEEAIRLPQAWAPGVRSLRLMISHAVRQIPPLYDALQRSAAQAMTRW